MTTEPVPTIERVVDDEARPRLGVVTRAQLLDHGLTDHHRQTALHRGGLVLVHRGVYRPAGVRLAPEGRLLAACAAAGPAAVASHRSALWLWGLVDDEPEPELTVPTGGGPAVAGATVHRSTDLHDAYRFVRRGVPTTTPARALLDAGAVLPGREVGLAVERALMARLVTVAGLRGVLDDLGRRGRRGAGPLRAYLDRRALGDARPESALEPLMARICRDHGVGPVLFQQPVTLDGRVYRPDFQVALAKLAVEVDGLSVHGDRAALDADLERQNAFIRNGWLVLRYTSTHLRRPARVAREVIETARRRLAETRSLRS